MPIVRNPFVAGNLVWECQHCGEAFAFVDDGEAHEKSCLVGLAAKKPTVPEVLPLAQEYYSLHGAGGNLHIVLDDGNIDDVDIEFCLQCAKEENDLDGIKLAELLLKMSKTQRGKIYKSCRAIS